MTNNTGLLARVQRRMQLALGGMSLRVAGVALKAAGVSFLPGWVRDPLREFTIRQLVDYGYKNSAVYACIRVLAESFPEPELHVFETTPDGSRVIVADHPLRALLAGPNPFMAEDEFWETCITYAAVGGNFYIWKERNSLGLPLALWPFHDGQMGPVLDGRKWISHYELDTGDGPRLAIPTSEIIHWRWSIDPRQPQVGLSPLLAATRPVDMDNEYLRYEHALAFNDAVPRTVLKTKLGYDDAKLAALKKQWKDAFGGAGRGDVAILSDPDAEILRVGANLAELAVEAIHNIPESRVAAVYGGAPVGYLAGLNVHLQRSTFANYAEAELALVKRVLPAKWRSVAATITKGLLREFTDDPSLVLDFDTSRVQALQGERQASELHARDMYLGGVWSRNEARAATGKAATAQDIILEPTNAIAVEMVLASAAPAGTVLEVAPRAPALPGPRSNGGGAQDEAELATRPVSTNGSAPNA